MTEEQRPARERAYQPWTDQEYGVLERRYKSKDWSLGRLALSLSRYPNEIELALERLRSYNEELANKEETIRNFPERLIAKYGSGLREFPVVAHARGLVTDAELDEIEKRIPEDWTNKHAHDYILRKARRLTINGKNYDTLLGKARERVHLQIEISATLAGGK